MSTSFGTGPTRDVQPGDTPDLNDGLVSRPLAVQNIPRGTACYVSQNNGHVTIGTTTLAAAGDSPFVPVESIDNSDDDDLNISGVIAPQRVAVTIRLITGRLTIYPGDYLRLGTTVGVLEKWIAADVDHFKYAQFLGIEAGLLDRAAATPFDETLTPGIVPDQSVTGADTDEFVGWVQLMENPGT